MNKQHLIPEFTRLYSEINSVVLLSNDHFLIETITKQLEDLLKCFLEFMLVERYLPVVRHDQFQKLNFQFSNIVTTLSIFSHLNKISHIQTLDIERDVLLLRRSLLALETVKPKNKSVVIHKRNKLSHKSTDAFLNPIQKRILGFIDREGEMLNLDVFNHFKDLSKRTLKRHLSRLVSSGYVSREAQGKKVYYKKPVVTINKVMGEAN